MNRAGRHPSTLHLVGAAGASSRNDAAHLCQEGPAQPHQGSDDGDSGHRHHGEDGE